MRDLCRTTFSIAHVQRTTAALLVGAVLGFWSMLSNAATLTVPTNGDGCYSFAFLTGTISVGFQKDLESPRLTFGTGSNAGGAPDAIPELEKKDRVDGCTVITWRPANAPSTRLHGKTKQAAWTLLLPVSTKKLSVTVLKGQLFGNGPAPSETSLTLRMDQGALEWRNTTASSITINQTEGVIALENVTADLAIQAQKSNLTLKNIHSTKTSEINLKHGTLDLAGSRGALKIESHTATINTSKTHGPLSIQSITGSITSEEAQSVVDLKSRHGDVSSRWIGPITGLSKIVSGSGQVQLWVASTANTQIEAEGLSLSDLPAAEDPVTRKKIISLTGTEGKHRVVAHSEAGNLTIKRF